MIEDKEIEKIKSEYFTYPQFKYLPLRVVEKGIEVAGSSDCPVASVDPFLGIYSAVSPKDLEGKNLPDWVRKGRIGIKEPLKIFTDIL